MTFFSLTLSTRAEISFLTSGLVFSLFLEFFLLRFSHRFACVTSPMKSFSVNAHPYLRLIPCSEPPPPSFVGLPLGVAFMSGLPQIDFRSPSLVCPSRYASRPLPFRPFDHFPDYVGCPWLGVSGVDFLPRPSPFFPGPFLLFPTTPCVPSFFKFLLKFPF